jgi:hypothetical protein
MMHNRFRILLFLLVAQLVTIELYAQNYGNEWINFNQKYYAFNVYSTGIHRLDYTTISTSGIPVSTFQSANVQIFGREREIPLYIHDGGDSYLNPGDYILFYAEQNDGWLDSTLYDQPGDIGNPKYSLYNDTIQYFFTWNNATNNLRFVQETDVAVTSYAPSNYVLFERYQSNYNYYNEGEKSAEASSSFFTSGEGWGSTPVNGASGYVWDVSSLELEQIYQGIDAPNVEYRAVSVGVSNASYTGMGNHHVKHTIGSTNYVMADTTFVGYRAAHISKTFPSSVLPATGPSNFKISIVNDQGAATDYQSINYWSFVYPRTPSFGGINKTQFKVKNNPTQSKIKVNLTNISTTDPLIFVLGNVPRKLNLISVGGNTSLLLPNSTSGNTQTIIYQESSTVQTVGQLTPVNTTGSFNDYSQFSAEKSLLMVYHPAFQSASADYAAYRMSPDGGQYNVILANINELYQQFGGGVPKHINGVRRFSRFVYDQASEKPVGLFLMGKGIREANVGGTTSTGPGSRTNPTNYAGSFIPSFGQPSCDACITSNLPGTTRWTPLIPTGRIAATSNQELADYLEKVQLYEQNQDQTDVYNTATKDWQKQVLHFVGGTDAGQQALFGSYMSEMANVIENQYFGANVSTTAQNSADPINPSQLNSIMDHIQDGVSMITFFGHAAPTSSGFEINIDEPTNWNNTGKYPLVISNSCYNGNIFQSGTSRSEKFVNIPNYGAIGYLGTVNLGFAHTLYLYSDEFYRQVSLSHYGSTLGEQIRYTINTIESAGFSDLLTESTCSQMTLNGDPMVRLNWHEKPEIEITEQSVSFSPDQLDLTVDSIQMDLVLTNLGKSIIDTFSVEITRNFPGSSMDSVYTFYINQLHYKDTLSFKMPLQSNIGLGINTFSVKVDLPTFVDEIYDEVNNNQLVKTLFIDVDGIIPVIPHEFAVVPEDSVTLIASTINPIAEFNTYRFELDTTDLFNSPFKRFGTVSGFGGTKEVNPSQWKLSSTGAVAPLVCTDSMVYFWRVSIDEPSPIWRTSSFQYIIGKEGWGQDHFFQFRKNSYNAILYDDINRKKLFSPNNKTLTCDVKSTTAIPGIYENAYFIDGQNKEYGICTYTPSFYVAVIDPVSLEQWNTRYGSQNPDNNFGNANDNGACRPRSEGYFIFRQNSYSQLSNFQTMISNVPDSHYILVYSPMTTYFDQVNSILPSIYNTFQNLGSDSIVPGVVRPNLPFAFFCRKGDPSTVVELYAQQAGEDLHLEADLQGYDYVGQEFSTMIGPAAEWRSVFWKQDSLETVTVDSTVLYIRAFDQAGSLQMVIDTTFTSNDSIVDLGSLIDAQSYPFIQLGAYYKDSLYFSPAQIDRWHVLYSPLPEAAIDGSSGYSWIPSMDTITEGEDISFAVDVKNIFTIPMDSLLVNYWVMDQNEVKHPINYPRQDSLLVGETMRDTITFSTVGLSGINSFWMEVNPYTNASLTITDQPEQEHFNNLLQLPFYVTSDDKQPILDVTFNGHHILNNDIVAPESEIYITLKDDNEFLLMDESADTTHFGIYLTDPDGIQTRIPFMDGLGNVIMQWIPAESQHKKFKIIYPANFVKDGKYTLFVQGSDKSGNLSGDLEYRISFEVIHESMITYVMNYPNPFSTSTRFVFTLTGNEVPDEVLIQIMTVSGKVVREISEDEIGTIQIGRNISEYAWDGKDEFGDPLANGVYLYRVKAQINGEDIKHLESGADSHFKKEFGKMYIIR